MNTFYYPVLWLVLGGIVIGLLFVSGSISYFRVHPHIRAFDDRSMRFLEVGQRLLQLAALILLAGGIVMAYTAYNANQSVTEARRQQVWPAYDPQTLWQQPDAYLAETDANADLIVYGRDLVAHTQDYFGENGLVRPKAINGMNCQNCHLDAGTKPFGNNYFAVTSTYPQMRARSGSLETIPKRINDCFQRSLNGQPLDTNSREMRAMMAYIQWLGTGIPKGEKPKGTGLVEVPFLNRAADPVQGQRVFMEKCTACHGADGQGLPIPDGARTYPPLWGPNSYNEAAGLFRMSRFAGYVKANMPLGATHDNPQLTDEETWDVAAFVNSQPRPKHPFLATDWPKIDKKPFDHPFGPFKDSFPETQHKYGPFGPILAYYKAH